ncbi:MAG: nucleotidyltransferase family protein [Anaeromyxobacteraceae bacterium]
MALLDALRALTAFDPPDELPACDPVELGDVLDAHGLGAMASYQLESRRIGASAPRSLRERVLPLYQGTVNDNVFRLVTLKGAVREIDVPVVLLGGAAYVDWLYPHLAFRPIGELRLAVKGDDGARFAQALAAAGFSEVREGAGGHTATLGDGRIEIAIQEGLVPGAAEAHGLFERSVPFAAMGRSVARPAAEDALLASVADIAAMGLFAPLLLYLDVRELVRQPELASTATRDALRARAEAAGLSRALFGALALTRHFYPEVTEAALALSPTLGRAEQAAVQAIVERAGDPLRLRLPRGADAAARAVVAPR